MSDETLAAIGAVMAALGAAGGVAAVGLVVYWLINNRDSQDPPRHRRSPDTDDRKQWPTRPNGRGVPAHPRAKPSRGRTREEERR